MGSSGPAAAAGVRQLVLVGAPNVGKSALFGRLTGIYAVVSNYPGTSVEVTRGRFTAAGAAVEVLDTPGMYSMLSVTEEERVARSALLVPGQTVIHVIEASHLERSLPLTLQLLALGARGRRLRPWRRRGPDPRRGLQSLRARPAPGRKAPRGARPRARAARPLAPRRLTARRTSPHRPRAWRRPPAPRRRPPAVAWLPVGADPRPWYGLRGPAPRRADAHGPAARPRGRASSPWCCTRDARRARRTARPRLSSTTIGHGASSR